MLDLGFSMTEVSGAFRDGSGLEKEGESRTTRRALAGYVAIKMLTDDEDRRAKLLGSLFGESFTDPIEAMQHINSKYGFKIPVPELPEKETEEVYGLEEARLILGDELFEALDKRFNVKSRSNVPVKLLRKFIEEYKPPKPEEDEADDDVLKKEQDSQRLTEMVEREKKSILEDISGITERKPKPRLGVIPDLKITKKDRSKVRDPYLNRTVNLIWIRNMGIDDDGMGQLFEGREAVTIYELTNWLVERRNAIGLGRIHNIDFLKGDMINILTYLNAKYKGEFSFMIPGIKDATYEEASGFVYRPGYLESVLGELYPVLEKELGKKQYYTRKEIGEFLRNIDGNLPRGLVKELLDEFSMTQEEYQQ